MSKRLLSIVDAVVKFILRSLDHFFRWGQLHILESKNVQPFNFNNKTCRTVFVHSEAAHNKRNEDELLAQEHPDDGSALICILADGQGGQAGGAIASQVAVKKCLELAAARSIKELGTRSAWHKILSGVDDYVSSHPEAGFTTLIGLCVNNDEICGASCGDSTTMVVKTSHFDLLTEKQRKNPPVGSGAVFPIAFSAKLKPNDKLLLMSDGVWRFIGYDVIAQASRKEKGQDLVATIRRLQTDQSGGKLQDDFSLIIVE